MRDMLTEERQSKILDELKAKKVVKVRELIEELNVSESTIRRDLQELEAEGWLVRVHGGAKQVFKLEPELTMKEKSSKNVHKKQEIVQLAASLVKKGDMLYIDAGTTTLELLPLIKDKSVTIVTNSVHHAFVATDLGMETIMIGGKVRQNTKASVSQLGGEQLTRYFFDKAFMGANGVHPIYGLTTADPEEAMMKRTAIHQAQQVYFLVDDSKFDKLNFSQIESIDTGVILTNQLTDKQRSQYQGVATIKEVEK